MRRAVAAFVFFLSTSSAFAFQYAMWVPGWGSAQLSSIQVNAGSLSETNPFWYQWNSDFTIAKKSYSAVENPTWRAAMTGTLLIPTITNSFGSGFDKDAAVKMLSTAASREAHANAVVQLVLNQGYDGIDIDYERVPTSSRANLTAFLTTLSTKLHAMNKKLSVCVYAKRSDDEDWDGAGAQDWSAIGQLADSVKVMAYDYSYSGSAAGPIAPLPWLDAVATYAERTIPGQKIMIGLPFYGYDWSGSNGTDVSYSQAMATAQRVGATITRDNNGEPTFSYSGRTVYFQDATSYKMKLDLIKQKHPSIGGVSAWAAGMEDPEIWKVIRGVAVSTPPATTPTNPGNGGGNGSGSGATPVVGDFMISGPTVLTVKPDNPTSATYAIVPMNGFASNAAISFQTTPGFVGTVSASSVTVVPNAPVTVNIRAASSTPAGVYQIVVRFASGSLVRDHVINVAVKGTKSWAAMKRSTSNGSTVNIE